MLYNASSPEVANLLVALQAVLDTSCLGAGALKLEVLEGPRYLKLVRSNAKPEAGTTRSVYLFVDRTNGSVLKAASWASPAKGARGSLSDIPAVADRATPYGFR